MEEKLADMLEDNKVITLSKLMGVLEKLDRYGFLDVVNGLLEDEETVGKVIGAVVNDQFLSLFGRGNEVMDLLDLLTNGETVGALKDVVELYSTFKRTGIMEPLAGLLRDEELLGKVIGAVVNDSTLTLATKWNEIVDSLAKIDFSQLKYYVSAISLYGNGIRDPNKVVPIRGFMDILKLLKDPDVQRGIGILLAGLKELGRSYDASKL
ncbi:hypothetical protein HS1genome_1537 [Sulfodiicoccus acidiphilus]|uniref:DUF1641 domain-containing protein n=1 Tax=Sulfodiicoccus acidiphilus TaxID=1670455 RepID=A0A348B4P6_9CREN|nr:DUF1641 domain-containing protein [Sulfodiicoccus acidiphilus]BBD73148.1 hypothetical protein HS1genome_1537 [Sulfodiicoccus acidiphilus]GGU00471.1 hypothetical protein GCM10007116_17120 [Sulfodiicoccus acidiphilus]